MVQLYYGINPDSLTPLTSAPLRFRDPADVQPPNEFFAGTWAGGGFRTLTGVNRGDTIFVQIRAWDGTGGLTYDQARSIGLAWGDSATFTYRVPDLPTGAPDEYIDNFRSFTLVPEPSVIMVGVVGVLVMVVLTQRKTRLR
jgi:hypothetical protein